MKSRMVLLAALVLGIPAVASADTYKVDTAHSSIFFRVKHLNVSYAYGRFNDITGTLNLDDKNPAAGSITLEVKAESIDTANAKRDQHLRGPDFFNTKEFPTITFKSTAIKQGKPQVYEVTGDLTLHGVTKSITVELKRVGAANAFGKDRVGFETNFTIRRSDYGMNYMPGALGDDIWLLVGIEAIKE